MPWKVQKSGKVRSWELGMRTEQGTRSGISFGRFVERGGVSGLEEIGEEGGGDSAIIVSQSSRPGEGGRVGCFWWWWQCGQVSSVMVAWQLEQVQPAPPMRRIGVERRKR